MGLLAMGKAVTKLEVVRDGTEVVKASHKYHRFIFWAMGRG